MKKIIAMVLALMLVVGLVACGAKPAETSAPAPEATPEAPSEEAPAEEAPAEEAPAEEAPAEETPAEEAPAEEAYVVGICQLAPHPALDQATQGFKDALTEALGDKVTFKEGNAAGDTPTCATIVNGFVADNVDLIMANATGALQAGRHRHLRYPRSGHLRH